MSTATHQHQQQQQQAKRSSKRVADVDKILLGFVWRRYWCLDTKFLLTFLFLLSSLLTFLHLLPAFRLSTPTAPTTTTCLFPPPPPSPPPPPPPPTTSPETTNHQAHLHYIRQEEQQQQQRTKRAFHGVGAAAFLFVHMGTYRAGPSSFAIVGLSSKPLHVYANPVFSCHWQNHSSPAVKILPDWGYGRIYTVLVLNCTFDAPVGADGSGGELVLHASAAGGDGSAAATTERMVVLSEAPGDDRVRRMLSSAAPKYDVLYCGSPLYGDLSPQRMREWLAYHVKLFGRRSHFVLYDAGGVHGGVMEVLRPWMKMGYVSLQDIREQERFDGYYHNQFLVVNDCLHRYRFDARWMFFFDVDEFIYVSPRTTLEAVLDGMSGVTQFTFEQRPMSCRLCLSRDSGRAARMWGIEKMVYRDVKRGIRRDRKYALQPRNAFATGVHMSQNIVGKSVHRTDGIIKYFHYHGTINYRHEPCKQFVDESNLTYEGTPYVLDTTLRLTTNSIKKFELNMIGKRLQRTRQ